MIKNIGIGFVTGRKHFKNVLKTYVNNWVEYGLIADKEIRFHLFVAYDLKYQNTSIKDYRNIDPMLEDMIDTITFLGEERIKKEREDLVETGKINTAESELLFGDGYAKKRNSVLYFAMKNNMDKLIFLDDDEYPMAVFRDQHSFVSWAGQSVVGTHLKHNDNADITHGYHCGYISPIPSLIFNETLTETHFKLFIETISNDIVSWENVKLNIIENNGVTYADEKIVRTQQVKEVPEVHHMKFISGANLCFNLTRKNKIPPFFNPPGARGEDTFMSTCLSELKVLKVPCYAFHDGFSTHNNLLNGILSINFLPVDSTSPEVITRFIKATIGWIRYKPLLMYITQREDYDKLMVQMKANLKTTIPKLCAYFNTDKFQQLFTELEHYDKNVKKHFASFESTKNAWTKVIS